MKNAQAVGIDDMALYVPKLYLPIETLAKEREIEYVKLNKGLGLTHMAIPDVHEDAATMAANAVSEIIDKNELNPSSIGRIYLGTESALDGAKPTATYVVQMLKQKYAPTYGENCFVHCDVVDLTFACVGGIDALHNTLDWVRGDEERMGIVVTSDFAKYELASTGEYTQGAGAVAILVKHDPRLLVINNPVGVGMQSAHDFYKPLRTFSKKQIVEETLRLAGVEADAENVLSKLNTSLEVNGFIDDNDAFLTLHKDTPVFDGPYSNLTYQNRIREAYEHFRKQAVKKEILEEKESILNRWERLIFHLPYAFHGKRIFSEIYMQEKMLLGAWDDFAAENGLEIPDESQFEDEKTYHKAYSNFLRAITKTPDYRAMVKEKLEKAQRASGLIGNMYACSIFLALMSTLDADLAENADLERTKFGFFGYGSGSKSKVFEAEIQPSWKGVVTNFKIKEKLESRTAIDYETYEQLHRKRLAKSVQTDNGKFAIASIGTEGVKLGARYYELK
ncbi:MAG: hydroxymethylglutaryl-CoA synthase [Bacteroidota bacterium]